MVNQAPALAPHPFQNMIKFSDLPKFLGKSRDVDTYVKTIQSQIDNAGNMFLNNTLKTSFFWLVAWTWSTRKVVSWSMRIPA